MGRGKSLEPTMGKVKSLEPAMGKIKSLEPAMGKVKSLELTQSVCCESVQSEDWGCWGVVAQLVGATVQPQGHPAQSGVRIPAGAYHSRDSDRRQMIPLCKTENIEKYNK